MSSADLNKTFLTTPAMVDHDDDSQKYCAPAELWMRIMCITAGAICIALGGIGNLTTLLSIATVRSLWRFTNINIFLLAVCDFTLTTYVTGHYIDKYWRGCWIHSIPYCHFYASVLGLFYYESLVLLALVSYDRYLMVRYGAGYSQRESRRTVNARASVTFVIMFVIIFPAINYHWISGVSVNAARGAICVGEVVQNGAYYLILTCASMVPTFVMLFCYLAVLRYHRTATVLAVGTTTVSTAAQLTVKKRAARARLLVNSMFFVLIVTSALYLLTTVVVSMISAGYWLTLDAAWWVNLYLASYTVVWLNNAINPILYAHAMPEFRRAARSIWKRVFAVFGQGHLIDGHVKENGATTGGNGISTTAGAVGAVPERK